MKKQLWNVRELAVMGILGAMSALLMLVEVPLTFIAPDFYKLDLSELPVMIGTFALGPAAGVAIELVKILIKFLIKGTGTGGVGELANFLIGCAMVLPAGILYRLHKTKKRAVAGLALGTLFMAAAGAVLNALVLLPFYSKFMPLETIIALGAKIIPAVRSVWSFVLLCVVPFNLIKGVVISLLTMLLYKRVSPLIHQFSRGKRA